MTDLTPDTAIVATAAAEDTSYVDWPAIVAGIVLAAALSLLLLTFGSAIGLGFADFRAGEGVSPIWIGIAAALWLLWVQISSFMAGGYLTGRLRRRHGGATEHEVDVRDGAHGLLVWAGALLVGALIAAGGLGAAATAIGAAASGMMNGAPAGAEATADPDAYFVDLLFRPAAPAGAAAPEAAPETATEPGTETAPADAETAPDAPAATTALAAPAPMAPAAATTAGSALEREEALRIFTRAGDGELPAADRDYLVQIAAANAGLPGDAASARVDEVLAARDTARAEAEATAETARKAGVLAAFLTAAALLVSAAGAFWAAQKGGQHRDDGTVFADVFRRL